MAMWKMGAALATGCTIVLKPSGADTADRPLFSGINRSGGLPDGVINIVPGFGETAGEALTNHDDVDKLAFTDSTEIGKKSWKKPQKN